MLAKATVKVEGVDNVIKNMEIYKKKFSYGLVDAANAGSKIIESAAKSKFMGGSNKNYNAPPRLRTGDTLRMITSKMDGNGMTYAVSHIGLIGLSKEEAIMVNSLEFGHAFPSMGKDSGYKKPDKRVQSRPFMRPAIHESKRKVNSVAKTILSKVI